MAGDFLFGCNLICRRWRNCPRYSRALLVNWGKKGKQYSSYELFWDHRMDLILRLSYYHPKRKRKLTAMSQLGRMQYSDAFGTGLLERERLNGCLFGSHSLPHAKCFRHGTIFSEAEETAASCGESRRGVATDDCKPNTP